MLSFLMLLVNNVVAESLVVRVAIDDRQFKRLKESVVLIEGLSSPLLDNGSLPGDVANDGIFVGQANIQHQESLILTVQNADGQQVGQLEVSVPEGASATFQLKTSNTGIVLDLNAPNMPAQEAKAPTDDTILQVQAVERSVTDLPEGQSEILIRLDASTRALNEPMLTIAERPEWTMLSDDGGVDGDDPDDGIYTGLIRMPARESLQFKITDSGKVLGNLQASLPSAQGVEITLRYNQYGLSSAVQDDVDNDVMVGQATPKGERIVSTSASDKIALTVFFDDRLRRRLQIPAVTFLNQPSAGVNFRDDGGGGDEEANDHIWIASTVLEREEFVQLTVIDKEIEQGQLTVFLPSTSEAVVWLRGTESGVKLITEPTQGSTEGSATTSESTGVGMSSDRLAHVLWVMMALFAIGFAYVRTVFQQRWATDVEPTMRRMNQFLDRQTGNQEQEDIDGSDNT